MKTKNLFIIFIILVGLINFVSAVAYPHAFYGSVKNLDGSYVEGSIIAKIDGVMVGRSSIINGEYDLVVESNYGGTIYFYLDEKEEPLKDYVFDSFEITNLNLVVIPRQLTISNINIEPEKPLILDNIKICADVTSDSDIIIVRINLHSEEPWNWGLIMTHSGENRYCRELSPYFMHSNSEDKTRSYYISARNYDGELEKTKTYYYTYIDPSIPEPPRIIPSIGDWISNTFQSIIEWFRGIFGG